MVRAELLEAQIASYVGSMRLPPEYLGEVVAELRRRQRGGASPNEMQHVRRELERWRRLFVLGEIDEERYRNEAAPLKRRLADLDRPREVLDVEKAVNYLRDMGNLWAESPRHLQRELINEVFARIVVEGTEVSAITPKPAYSPLFLLDRRERFQGEVGVVWYPRQVSKQHHYTPIKNPRTGEAFGVPALVLPEVGSGGLVPAQP